jgi:IclR family acetate operon transcriptional repressor
MVFEASALPRGDENEHGPGREPGFLARSSKTTTVKKVTLLLQAVAAAPEGISVREVSRQTGIDKSAISRLLEQLTEGGFVGQEPLSSRFQVGPALFALAATVHATDTLWQAAEPVVRGLAERFNETCYLATLDGDHVLFTRKIDCDHVIRYVISPTERRTLHAGAGGRAVLAGMTGDALEGWFARATLERYTAQSIANRDDLLRQISEDQARGYSISVGERAEGACAIASPFHGADGGCLGSIVYTCPRERFDLEQAPAIAEAVMAASKALSARLGYVRR